VGECGDGLPGRRLSLDERSFVDGPIEVVVLPEVGARIHRLQAFGYDLLRTPTDPDEHRRDTFFWGAYPMAPWCGRVEAAPITLGGKRVDFRPNFPDGTAIHGQVHARPWDALDDGSFRIRAGGDEWPWAYEVGFRVRIDGETVRLDYTLTNRSEEPMPGGIGVHPWWRHPLRLAIHAERVFTPNQGTPPEAEPVSGSFDLRELGIMAPEPDATWTDLSDPPVEFEWPDAGIRGTMRADAPSLYIVAANRVDLGGTAVEPQTNVPQPFRRLLNDEPGAPAWLGSGEDLQLRVELAFEQVG
jgi:aldose 1-epimerase